MAALLYETFEDLLVEAIKGICRHRRLPYECAQIRIAVIIPPDVYGVVCFKFGVVNSEGSVIGGIADRLCMNIEDFENDRHPWVDSLRRKCRVYIS